MYYIAIFITTVVMYSYINMYTFIKQHMGY